MTTPGFRKQTFLNGGSAVETDHAIMGQGVISCFTKQKTGGSVPEGPTGLSVSNVPQASSSPCRSQLYVTSWL